MLERASVEVWRLAPGELSPERLDGYRASLSHDERRRLARFRIEEAALLYLVARGELRRLLGRLFHVSPATCCFVYDGTRPRLGYPEPPPGFDFNVSHTRGMVAIALASGDHGARIGIDVEATSRPWEPALPARFFSPDEIAALEQLAPEQRQQRFYRLWTLKESFLKARGDGLATPLDSFTVAITADDTASLVCSERIAEDPASWQLMSCEFASGHVLGLALKGGCGAAVVWRE